MHFITCDFCGKIKRTTKKFIICSVCKKKAKHKEEKLEGYNYDLEVREIPPSDEGKFYKINPNVNVFVELAKTAILKDYKMKHKYELKDEEKE